MKAFQDRVKELTRLKPSDIEFNPKNFREHPPEQLDLINGVFNEIGIAGCAIVYKTERDTWRLIDGAGRKEFLSDTDQEMPCVVLDVNDKEADKLIAYYDLIASKAEINQLDFRDLLEGLDHNDKALQHEQKELLSMLDRKLEPKEEKQDFVRGMELSPNESYDYILVLSRTNTEWEELKRRLKIKDVRTYGNKIGVGRAIDATHLIEILDGKHNES